MALYLFRNYIYSFNAVINKKEVNFMMIVKITIAMILLVIVAKAAEKRKENLGL